MILFVSYGGGHISISHRVYSYFLDKGEDCKLLPLTTATIYCKKLGMTNFLRIEDFVDTIDFPDKLNSKIEALAKEEHNDAIGIDWEHTLAYYKIGFYGLFKNLGIQKGLSLYKTYGRKVFIYDYFAEYFLKKINAKAVITTNVPRMERAFVRAANNIGLVTASIDDLFGLPLKPLEADLIFVDNSVAKKNLHAVNPDLDIKITGNPVFQDLINKSHDSYINNSLLIVLQTGVRNLVEGVIYEFNDEFYSEFFKSIKFFLKSFDRIIVRFHPSMKVKKYWGTDMNIEIDNNIDIHKTISESEYAIGMTSTGLYESYLAGCKVYALRFNDKFFSLPIPPVGKMNMNGEVEMLTSKPVNRNRLKSRDSNALIYKYVKNEISNNRK